MYTFPFFGIFSVIISLFFLIKRLKSFQYYGHELSSKPFSQSQITLYIYKSNNKSSASFSYWKSFKKKSFKFYNSLTFAHFLKSFLLNTLFAFCLNANGIDFLCFFAEQIRSHKRFLFILKRIPKSVFSNIYQLLSNSSCSPSFTVLIGNKSSYVS